MFCSDSHGPSYRSIETGKGKLSFGYFKGLFKISRIDPAKKDRVFLLQVFERGIIFYGRYIKGLPFL